MLLLPAHRQYFKIEMEAVFPADSAGVAGRHSTQDAQVDERISGIWPVAPFAAQWADRACLTLVCGRLVRHSQGMCGLRYGME